MKKKIAVIMAVMAMIVACAFGAAACTDDPKDDGEMSGQYLFWELSLRDGQWYAELMYSAEFDNGQYEKAIGDKGTYKVENGKLTLDDSDDTVFEKKSDGGWYAYNGLGDEGFAILKEGKYPQGCIIKN